MKIEYYIINPAGNITALVTSDVKQSGYKSVAAKIMNAEPTVEQVGFVRFCKSGVNLNMSGGEFCGNATMSAAALCIELGNAQAPQIPVTVFPYKEPFCVTVNTAKSGYTCECEFFKPEAETRVTFSADGVEYTFPLARFEGITHIVADNTLSEASARRVIKRLANELKTPALGIMLYDGKEKSLVPLVYVSALDTLFRENSCASGSCALAAVLPEFSQKTDISEPGGTICAYRGEKGICLKTNVKIIKKCFGEI